jgi:hypothetical protein
LLGTLMPENSRWPERAQAAMPPSRIERVPVAHALHHRGSGRRETVAGIAEHDRRRTTRHQGFDPQLGQRERKIARREDVLGGEITLAPHIEQRELARAFEAAVQVGGGRLINGHRARVSRKRIH